MSFNEEARRIQGKALDGQACVVRLGQLIFFSTESGDAWMLDPEDGFAVCLARDFEPRPIPIQETPAKLAIEWNADYTIEGEAFRVVERHGSARTILGYPTAEIQRLSMGVSATPRQNDDADQARERLKAGRNDPCLCGSGKKYKKCCLGRDEALVRDAAEEARKYEPLEPTSWTPADASDTAAEDATSPEPVDSPFEIDTDLPPEALREADALWRAFEALERPTAGQMDALLTNVLALPAEATEWYELFHRFARHNYPDLPGVFRRIAAAIPHTKDAGTAFFYWAAADEFACGQYRHLLPEVAAASRRLNLESYDADGLSHIKDNLLAEGFEAETLELAEHFLPVLRADGNLMPYVVPEVCELIFELRVGRHLRTEPSSAKTPDLLAQQLRRDIEEEIHLDAARNAAEVIVGQSPVPAWAPAQFDLVSGDIRTDDAAWQRNLRLYAALIHVAAEAWQLEQRPPGCAFRGLSLLLTSVYDWRDAKGKKRKRPTSNLLDALRPAGLEPRLIQACPEIMGVNKARARLLLDAHGILLRFAVRHQLISDADAAESERELLRLRHDLDRLERR